MTTRLDQLEADLRQQCELLAQQVPQHADELRDLADAMVDMLRRHDDLRRETRRLSEKASDLHAQNLRLRAENARLRDGLDERNQILQGVAMFVSSEEAGPHGEATIDPGDAADLRLRIAALRNPLLPPKETNA